MGRRNCMLFVVRYNLDPLAIGDFRSSSSPSGGSKECAFPRFSVACGRFSLSPSDSAQNGAGDTPTGANFE
eukprot:9698666-Alexandrium_andersonii.AAC.1